jgi:hypothetical protein
MQESALPCMPDVVKQESYVLDVVKECRQGMLSQFKRSICDRQDVWVEVMLCVCVWVSSLPMLRHD